MALALQVMVSLLISDSRLLHSSVILDRFRLSLCSYKILVCQQKCKYALHSHVFKSFWSYAWSLMSCFGLHLHLFKCYTLCLCLCVWSTCSFCPGLKLLLKRALRNQDPVLVKLVRNICFHEDLRLRKLIVVKPAFVLYQSLSAIKALATITYVVDWTISFIALMGDMSHCMENNILGSTFCCLLLSVFHRMGPGTSKQQKSK